MRNTAAGNFRVRTKHFAFRQLNVPVDINREMDGTLEGS